MTLVLDVWTLEVPEVPAGARSPQKYKVAILASYDTKSLRNLADELAGEGHKVSAPTVAALLREENFSLQANTKTIVRAGQSVTPRRRRWERPRGAPTSR